MKSHPAADLFPLLEGAAFDALVADIATNGLIHPIVTTGGLVLDGRNRLRACYEAEVKPQFVEYRGKSPLVYVVGANLARRHLDASQRAMMGARLKPLFEAEAEERLLAGTLAPKDARGKASEKSAAAVNVSAKGVERAAKVLERGARATIAAVDSGELAVTRAAAISDLPKSEQRAAVKDAIDPDEDPDYTAEDARREALADVEARLKMIDADEPLKAAAEEATRLRKHAMTLERLLDDKTKQVEIMKKEAQRWMRKAKKSAACQACMTALERE